MLNRFTKTMPWMAASLFAATSIFGQSCKPACEPCNPCQPHELLQCPSIAAYNAPARIDIQCGWDVWADASFIYWMPNLENSEPVEYTTPPVSTLGTVYQSFPNLDFKYKPGFKVGLGMSFDYDNWDASAEYTWLRGTHSRSAALSQEAVTDGGRYWSMWANPINVPVGAGGLGASTTAFNASWKLALNLLDFDLGRWFYVGSQLTMRPSVGARAAWIDQHRNSSLTSLVNTTLEITDNEKVDSWGIGPRLGLDMNWMIGEGFRFFGNSEFDILFTRYHTSATSATLLNGVNSLVSNAKQGHINTLRPHVDLELGIGWGTYFDCHKWHFDLSASYGYQVFWSQNMFGLTPGGGFIFRNTMPNGDLTIHGLTLTGRLDF